MSQNPPQTSPVLLDGKRVAEDTLERCRQRVAKIVERTGVTPALATLIVGADPASQTYVGMKHRRCEKVGLRSVGLELPQETTTEQLIEQINQLNADPAVFGILLQHPVPKHVDERAGFEAIDPAKDVDGVTLHSFGAMAMGLPAFDSCTPGGIMRLMAAYDLPIAGKHAVVVGRSPILGKPMAMMLLGANATVTICHSRTQGLAEVVRQGDIVVAAVGKPKFVQGDWIKPGAVVIDAGYHPDKSGDVDLEAAASRASYMTPVPGGVGPMTIATLIEQTVEAAQTKLGVRVDPSPGEEA